MGDQLTSQLAEAGIELTVNRVEFSTWLSDVYTNHDYDLSLVDHNESHDFASWANPDYYFGYSNATVQQLYQQAMASTDESEAEKLLAQAAKQVSQDAAADWLFNFRVEQRGEELPGRHEPVVPAPVADQPGVGKAKQRQSGGRPLGTAEYSGIKQNTAESR